MFIVEKNICRISQSWVLYASDQEVYFSLFFVTLNGGRITTCTIGFRQSFART